MRLTLRTLLAYLDNTLEPQDAEVLRGKLTESGFATQLVQRIRAVLVESRLLAPAPDAASPTEDANVIGEYLDSTLPGEQVAEIERACLESDMRLAETAACHQILTMVLGNKADVPPSLRSRIYELPEREIERIAATSHRFSSLAIDNGPPAVDMLSDLSADLPTAESSLTHAGGPVMPVGAVDSGVFDAPTRLRDSGAIEAKTASKAEAAMAGGKVRDVSDTAIYGGNIRTSRITPWLVSLALAGVLLFALTQIFAPLLNRQTALVDSDSIPRPNDTTAEAEIEVPPEMAPPMVAVKKDVVASEMLPPPTAMAEPDPDSELLAETESEAILSSDTQPEVAMDEDLGVDDFDEIAPVPPPMSDIKKETMPADAMVEATAKAEPGDVADASPPPAGELQQVSAPEIATIDSDKTIVATNKGVGDKTSKWVRLKKGMTVVPGFPIVCPPTFRATMTSISGFEVTLVGPAKATWVADNDGVPVLVVESGRILVKSNRPQGRLDLGLGGELLTLTFSDIESVAAASIKHFRSPGLDPLEPANRMELCGVLCVQGTVELQSDVGKQDLTTGQQWVKRGDSEPKVSPVDAVPDWIAAPDPMVISLEAGAREGLIELIGTDQPLEISLREATMFRRSEVASLAAQTLLHLDQGDVYFGSGGILSEVKQRAYWPDHFVELMGTVDRSAEAAEKLKAAIDKMDSANTTAIFRLLVGYSQKQLAEGGDESLVESLDSESMAVRVLALENLHKITGTTLYFRAEQDNAVRRAPGIKKWVARQRKGDIRWPE